MIIVDYSQIAIAAILASHKGETQNLSEYGCNNAILSMLRNLVNKHKRTYGSKKIVIACDHTTMWRKDVFEHYKAGRKKLRDDSKIDWIMLAQIRDKMEIVLRECFPYRVLSVEGAEADDIVGSLAMNVTEKTLIVGRDKDYHQLIRAGVDMYDPIGKVFVECKRPKEALKELIIRGDRIDGIPNVLSPADSFVTGTRQTVMTQGRFDKLMADDPSDYEPKTLARYEQNKSLIDMTMIPKHVQRRIFEAVVQPPNGSLKMIRTFLQDRNLITLLEGAQDFV